MGNDVLDGYAAAAVDLVELYEGISCDHLFRHVIDLIPDTPSRIADIGAGTGRDAAWLANKQHSVTAVEPVEEFRRAGGILHGAKDIEWLDDRLPELASLRMVPHFDMVLVNGVLQHLQPRERPGAIQSLSAITRPGGLVIMSLRHGKGPVGRPVYPLRADETIDMALNEGFHVLRARRTESIQDANRAAGVTWTWLVLRYNGTLHETPEKRDAQ